MSTNQELLTFALELATKAGELIAKMRAESSFTSSIKDTGYNLVTSADLASEKLINQAILNKFPTHKILSEEFYPEIKTPNDLMGELWIIDPIDGTVNYAHGHLHVCVSIAFAKDGVVQCGVVHAPFLNETYSGSADGPAFLNGKKLQIKDTLKLEDAIISTGFPYSTDSKMAERLGQYVTALVKSCGGIRRNGAAALDLCWVAAGRLSAHYEYNLKPWDLAAGGLIARQAGAIFGTMSTNQKTNKFPADLFVEDLLVSVPGIYTKMQALLNSKAD